MARFLGVCILAVLVFPVCLGAGLVAEYRFDGNLASSTGGPPLALNGGPISYATELIDGETMGVAAFPRGTGFLYPSPTSRDSYSIQMLVRLDDVSWRVKLMDFSGDTSPAGVYVFASNLHFFFGTEDAGRFLADTWHEVTFTRDAATMEGTIYLDGEKIVSFVDSRPYAVIDQAKGVGFLFTTVDGLEQWSAGAIARIRIHDEPIVPQARTPVRADIPCPEPTTVIPASERSALLDFYESTGGDRWSASRHWGCGSGTECLWKGVGCSDGKVGEISLGGNLLEGTLPASIANLTNLHGLYLSDNRQLGGAIPPQLGSLSNLEWLFLNGTSMEGSIPPELGNLSNLTELILSKSGVSGTIPPDLCRLGKLRVLGLTDNPDLAGEIPQCIVQMTSLEDIGLTYTQVGGTIPDAIGNLTKLRVFTAFGTGLRGEIPQSFNQLTNLEHVLLAFNNLSGPIPPGIVDMKNLEVLWLAGNDLTGEIPSGITGLTELEELWLSSNRITGPIPRGLDALTKLRFARLDSNQLSGTIPPELGNLPNLRELNLDSNLLEGTVPSEVGNLTALESFGASRNKLRGEVPTSLLNLGDASIRLADNALRASDPTLIAFLESKYPFASLQTVPPTGVAVGEIASYSVKLSWTPIEYRHEPGGYQILASSSTGGPYTALLTTPDKYASEAIVAGLQPSTRYHFIVKTVTYPHGGKPEYQLNTVFSDDSAEVSAMTLAPSPTPASVILAAVPAGIVQRPGSTGTVDSYTLTNIGGVATTITLARDGSFFEQSPGSFTLEPGASQIVALSGNAQPEGEYFGASLPAGQGVPVGFAVGVRLLVTSSVAGNYAIVAERNRIDLIAPSDEDPSGQVVFRNDGTGAFTGVASSDVEFLVPDTGLITINPGASFALDVRADRSKRPDADLLTGTRVGQISLIAIAGFDAKGRGVFSGASASLVIVADTVKPPTSNATIPPLASGEVALFLPSVGHVVGSVGEFISDLSILNAYGTGPARNLKLYYTPLRDGATTKVANLSSLGGSQAVSLADVVKSVFDGTSEVGSLMVRSDDASRLSVSANVFATSNPAGNYGTSIPVLRSDRSAATGEAVFLTGLRKDVSGHTNLFLQETGGAPVNALVEFLNGAGTIVGTRSVAVEPFAMASLSNPAELQTGTLAVRVTNVGGGGRLAVYATPVDRASGDTWAVADWGRQYGFDGSEPVVIPVAGAVAGANDTFFQTDLSVTNRCAEVIDVRANPGAAATNPCTAVTGTAKLRYYPQNGDWIEKEISIGLLGTVAITDVVRTLFGVAPPTVGHIVVIPVSDSYAVSSRTYNTVTGSPATYGSTVPALGLSTGIRPGQRRRIGGLQDSSFATIANRTPATNRTNFGIVETSGEPATVKMSVFYSDPKSLVAGAKIGEKIFQLTPNQFVSQSNVVRAVIGEERETKYRDLSGVQVQFEVISTTGAVMVYTSSVDNGTADSILRTE